MCCKRDLKALVLSGKNLAQKLRQTAVRLPSGGPLVSTGIGSMVGWVWRQEKCIGSRDFRHGRMPKVRQDSRAKLRLVAPPALRAAQDQDGAKFTLSHLSFTAPWVVNSVLLLLETLSPGHQFSSRFELPEHKQVGLRIELQLNFLAFVGLIRAIGIIFSHFLVLCLFSFTGLTWKILRSLSVTPFSLKAGP